MRNSPRMQLPRGVFQSHRWFAATVITLFGCSAAAPAPGSTELKLATWNLEWFMKPETLRALTPACLPPDAPRDGARRAVPCDVAHELTRSGEDIAALRRHARALDADVIALQEVDGPDAARLLFPEYEFCFSGRVAVQNNGFAIRRGLPFACGPDLTDISLGDDVRRGVELRVYPTTSNEIRLLSVHLKSGCSRDPLDSARRGCPNSPARSRPWRDGSTPRRANRGRSRCWATSTAICAGNRLEFRCGAISMTPIHQRPTWSIPRTARLFRTARLPRPSAATSIT